MKNSTLFSLMMTSLLLFVATAQANDFRLDCVGITSAGCAISVSARPGDDGMLSRASVGRSCGEDPRQFDGIAMVRHVEESPNQMIDPRYHGLVRFDLGTDNEDVALFLPLQALTAEPAEKFSAELYLRLANEVPEAIRLSCQSHER